MKRIFTFFLTCLFLSTCFFSSYGQARVVVLPGWDPMTGGNPDDFNNIFFDAVIADSTGRMENPNTIYELKRGHLYPQGNILKNFGYHLHIRAEEGDGPLPQFIPGKKSDGSYGNDYMRTEDDMTLENISFNAFRPDGAYLNRCVEIHAAGSRTVIDGCIFYGDRGAGITLKADSLRVFIKNVTVGNAGHRKSTGGNGRLVDLRPQAPYVDTLVIENSTVYNASDRVVRNMGSIVNYLYIDHITAFNTKGWHGGVQLGYVRNATVKNSLFANVISMGHNPRINEQTQPEKHFAVITIDTVFDGQSIVVRNNNIYYDQIIIDVWAKYDSVSAPYSVAPTLEIAVGSGNVDNMFFEEVLVLNQVCDPISDYVDAVYANPAATEFPENWCVGGAGGFFPNQIDAGYADTYDSYTAADGDYPVGNLNYFPDKKAEWEANPPNSVSSIDMTLNEFSIYPNPTTSELNIKIDLQNSSKVNISIMDMSGRVVSTVLQNELSAGTHVYSHDVSTQLSKGMYFITVQTEQGITTQKLFVEGGF